MKYEVCKKRVDLNTRDKTLFTYFVVEAPNLTTCRKIAKRRSRSYPIIDNIRRIKS